MRQIKKIADKIMDARTTSILIALLIVRIPYLLAYYPGLMIYDTGSSIAQFYGFKTHVVAISNMPDAILSNHHMILFTYLMGGFVKLGDLLGSQNLGFFLYVLIQVLLSNLIISYGLKLIKHRVNSILYLIILLLYMFLPVISLWQLTMSKDAFFSAFIMLYSVMLFRIVDTHGEIFKNKKFVGVLLAVTLMCVLSKQQGSYIVLICAVVLLTVYKKRALFSSIVMALIGVFYLTIFTGIILPNLHVAPSSKQEMMGFMFQQTAKYVVDYGEDVTSEEKNAINAVLPFDDLAELYDPYMQDSVKFEYNQESTNEERTEYIKTWFEMFFKHPDSYFSATLLNCSGFFLPGYENEYSYWPVYLEHSEILNEHENFTLVNVKPPIIYSGMTVIVELLGRLPVISLLFKSFFYVWTMIVGIVISLIKKRFETLIYALPAILSICLLFITPDVEFRYVLPFVYFVPVFYASIFRKKEQK